MMTINIIFEVFRIKVDRILSLPVTSYDNFSHRSIPLCIEMIQTETALMRKRNKSDHIKSIRFFFSKKTPSTQFAFVRKNGKKKTELNALTN